MLAIRHFIRNNKCLRERLSLSTLQFNKILKKSATYFFDKDSPFIKEKTDEIYPKLPKKVVEIKMQNIYEDYLKTIELYMNKDINTAYTNSNIILNDALLFKNHFLPLFVYNLLGRILQEKNDLKSAYDKFEKAEIYYENELDLKSEKYYSENKTEFEKLDTNIINNWAQIVPCIKNSYKNMGFILYELEKFEKSNEKLLYLLKNFNFEKNYEYFKILNILSLNYFELNQIDSAFIFCNKIIDEQIEYVFGNNEKHETMSSTTNDEFYYLIAGAHQQLAAILDSNNGNISDILSHYISADSCYNKCTNKDMYGYLNNLFHLSLCSQIAEDHRASQFYSDKLNEYLKDSQDKNIIDDRLDRDTLDNLRLKNYNLMIINYLKLENLEMLMSTMNDFLNMSMQTSNSTIVDPNSEKSLRNNFLYLFDLFKKNYEKFTDISITTKMVEKCLSQFLNWRIIPYESIDIEFYHEKLSTILQFVYLKIEKDSVDSVFLNMIDNVIKKFSVLSSSYNEEFKNCILHINLVTLHVEMMKIILNQNHNLETKLFSTFFEISNHTKESNLEELEVKKDIKEYIKLDNSDQIINDFLKLVNNMLYVYEKNKIKGKILLVSADRLVEFLKILLKEEKFQNLPSIIEHSTNLENISSNISDHKLK